MVPALGDAPVVLSPRAGPRSIQAKATGGQRVEASIRVTNRVEASIRVTNRVEASISVTSSVRGVLFLPRMADLGPLTRDKVGHLKGKITVKEGKTKSYQDLEAIAEAGVG